MLHALKNPDHLRIADEQGNISYGCDQEWFRTSWQRLSGCGPSVASNILLYMHRTIGGMLPFDVAGKADCLRLMESVWRHVTPTARGVYRLEQFSGGVHTFARENGYGLRCFSLQVPSEKRARPSIMSVVDFIAEGLSRDCPVAFLNLSNGAVSDLDNWHWVTVVSLRTGERGNRAEATAYDAEDCLTLDLAVWLETTALGGGFLYFTAGRRTDPEG